MFLYEVSQQFMYDAPTGTDVSLHVFRCRVVSIFCLHCYTGCLVTLYHNFSIRFLTPYRVKNFVSTWVELGTIAKLLQFETWVNDRSARKRSYISGKRLSLCVQQCYSVRVHYNKCSEWPPLAWVLGLIRSSAPIEMGGCPIVLVVRLTACVERDVF
jgi:hypothetical protein